MYRIFITGDTHGMMNFSKLVIFAKQNKLDRTDYIIICGDCGVLWDEKSKEFYINAYNSIGATILFVDGNHENFDMLYSATNIEWWHGARVHKISNHIYHVKRGEIFFLYGKSFLAIGGADSHDKSFRKENESWWATESITNENISNALAHLSNNDNYVDYVISHCPPNNILLDIENSFTKCGENVPQYIAPKLKSSYSNIQLGKILDNITFKKWFFGHLHIEMQLGAYCAVYENIFEIENDYSITLRSDKTTLETIKNKMIDALENMLANSESKNSNSKINKNSTFNKKAKKKL